MIRFPPKTILVPFDFTEAAAAAWEQARLLARRFQAGLEAIYVEDLLPANVWDSSRPRLNRPLRAEIERHLRAKLGAGFRAHIAEGDPSAAILKLARASRPDLIVMGTHGRAGWDRVWMGSVAEAVIRQSPAPVMTLRRRAQAVGSVLAPVNFTDYSRHGFMYAAAAAAALGVPLTVLHAVADPERCPNPQFRLNNLIASLPEGIRDACRPRAEAVTGSPVEGILKAARRHGMAVLVAHRKSLIEDVVLGTTVERVLRHAGVPVVAVPAPQRPFSWGKWTAQEASLPAR